MVTLQEVHDALKNIPPTEKSIVRPLSLALFHLSAGETLRTPLEAQVESILSTIKLGNGVADDGKN